MSGYHKYALLLGVISHPFLYASSDPQAIIGGASSGTAYSALFSSSGLTPIKGLPPGSIVSVAIGDGKAIVGGQDTTSGTAAYSALISSSGKLTPLSGLPSSGFIQSVAMNEENDAIIGGQDSGSGAVYAALVSSSGALSPISGLPSSGTAFEVAINETGRAIIGGENGSAAYATFVSSSGALSPISGLPANGLINHVAINDAGDAILGGDDAGDAYSALVSSSGTLTSISGIPTQVSIAGVAINDAGNGIIGGQNASGLSAYAALVSSSGTLTPISGLPTVGNIFDVDLNNANVAIVGGENDTTGAAYAAFVSPSGILTPISGLPSLGTINSVAINRAGVALVGGEDDTNGAAVYAALVSPSGVATSIPKLPASGHIDSVALLNAAVPSSYGPGSTFANSLFALSTQLLSNHLMAKIPFANKPSPTPKEVGLLVDASEVVRLNNPCPQPAKYSLWAAPFGEYAHQKKQNGIPSLNDWLGGVLIGFDYLGIQNAVIGAGAAYAYNYVHLSKHQGHARTNQEFVTLYGSWIRENFYINASLWGGYYQMNNHRNTPVAHITSRSHVDGWLFSPHLEISTPILAKGNWFTIDPFAMFDWANNWQGHVHEKGSSGFNLKIGSHHTSLLRTEAGLRFLETFQYNWGTFVLEEKGSWVNKLPFHTTTTHTYFVGSPSSFSIELFSGKTQNLGAVQLNAGFYPCQKRYPYGSINYQGEFGSSFQSHLVSFEIGGNF